MLRVVAKVQFTADGPGVRDRAASAIERWAENKFTPREADRLLIAQSGAEALFERQDDEVGDLRRTRFSILEPIDGGSLQTDVGIVEMSGRTAFSTVLSLGSDYGVSALDVSLRAPKFIKTVVEGPDLWMIGSSGERIFANSLTADAQNLDDLQALVESGVRRLPVLLVSEHDGRTLAGDLHRQLASDLVGLAHVVRLVPAGAWELTRRWGAEWSCYNGAVRLLWPMRGERGDPRAHPLWTMDRIMARTDDQRLARDQLRHVVGKRILEASTYVPDDAALADFSKAKTRLAADAIRAATAGSANPAAAAYEAEIASQREEIDRRDREIITLTDNMQTLLMQLRASRPLVEAGVDDGAPADVGAPQTVVEAVAIAKRELAGRLEIANETDADVAQLNPEAGPPEKVLRYLRVLAELGDRLARGSLGRSVPLWLRDHGVECSGESETAKNSGAAKRFRTRPVNGETIDCEFHAKPSDATSPDRCVRIFFGVGQNAPHVKVGYIGRHED